MKFGNGMYASVHNIFFRVGFHLLPSFEADKLKRLSSFPLRTPIRLMLACFPFQEQEISVIPSVRLVGDPGTTLIRPITLLSINSGLASKTKET